MITAGRSGRRRGAGTGRWRWALALAVVVHLVVLYWPFAVGDPGVPGLDKVVHAAVFGAVALAGRRAGVPPVPLAVALVVHAVASELVQGSLLPGRSADPLDVAADLVGTVLGLTAARVWARRRAEATGQAR